MFLCLKRLQATWANNRKRLKNVLCYSETSKRSPKTMYNMRYNNGNTRKLFITVYFMLLFVDLWSNELSRSNFVAYFSMNLTRKYENYEKNTIKNQNKIRAKYFPLAKILMRISFSTITKCEMDITFVAPEIPYNNIHWNSFSNLFFSSKFLCSANLHYHIYIRIYPHIYMPINIYPLISIRLFIYSSHPYRNILIFNLMYIYSCYSQLYMHRNISINMCT